MRYLLLSLAFVACADEVEEPSLSVDVAALTLEGVGDVVWDVQVDNGLGQVVWQKRLAASQHGDSIGSASWVGPCDASAPAHTVKLWVVGMYASDVTTLGTFASGAAGGVAGTAMPFQSPTLTGPITKSATCVANGDVPVRFDVTLMRPAEQGFFDVAVAFDDIFCSAKLDCCTDLDNDGCESGEELKLLFDGSNTRAPTVVMGFACSAGPNTATELYLDALELDCGAGSIDVTPANATGNLCTPGALSSCPAIVEHGVDADTYLFQVAAYRGLEANNSILYWNVGLGAKGPLSGCTLRTRGTADDGATADGVDDGTVSAGRVYPYVKWQVALDTCTSEGLTFGANAPVGVAYTGPAEATTFDYVFAPGASAPVAPGSNVRSSAGEYTFVVPSGVTSMTAKLWGGGGGGGTAFTAGTIKPPNGNGGAGGFASCPLAVTPGETLTLRVGGGGVSGTTNGGIGGFNGGAAGVAVPIHGTFHGGGPGGGASEVLRGSTILCVAGGGGGGAYSYPAEVASTGYGRGGGGGQQGEKGKGFNGTDTAGGLPGNEATKAGSVGTRSAGNAYGGGGGGGGFRGGTGGKEGAGGNGGTGTGGGGGSSFAPGGTIENAVFGTVPQTGDGAYVTGAAQGGVASMTAPTSGHDGAVVVSW